ncbi:MAG: mononuclear molybdenum enzyme YedY, partial [Anaerolineae bacterium]|nr:mononuclear molybdenum enzyme YedY [Anaerolineae bacterium]
MSKIKSSEITPEHIYLSRRKFMVGLGAVAFGSTVLAACGPQGLESLGGSAGENSDGAVKTEPIELAAIGPALSSETD